MTITELIESLEDYREMHGDIPVTTMFNRDETPIDVLVTERTDFIRNFHVMIVPKLQ